MMSALCNSTYKDGRPPSDREVAHMLTALLMAGQHTSSTSTSWTLMHLAHDQEVAEALYQEQVKFFSNPDGSLRSMTHEEMKGLPLLDGVIRETLRLHSPIHTIMVSYLSRSTNRNLKIPCSVRLSLTWLFPEPSELRRKTVTTSSPKDTLPSPPPHLLKSTSAFGITPINGTLTVGQTPTVRLRWLCKSISAVEIRLITVTVSSVKAQTVFISHLVLAGIDASANT